MNMGFLDTISLDGRNIVSDIIVIATEIMLLFFIFISLRFILKFVQNRLKKMQPAVEEKLQKVFKLVRLILTLILVLGILSILSFNIYQFSLGHDLKTYTLQTVNQIPPNFWKDLGMGIVKITVLIVIAKYVIKKVLPLLEKLKLSAVSFKGLQANNHTIEHFFARLKTLFVYTLWLFVLYAISQWFPFPNGLGENILLAINIFVIISIALLITNAIDAIVETIDEAGETIASQNNLLEHYNSLNHLMPLLKKSLEYIIYVTAATLIFAQLDFIAFLSTFGAAAISAIGILFISRVIIEVVKLLIDIKYLHEHLEPSEKKRNQTIFPIVKSVVSVFIYFIATILILNSFGFNPLPLLAGAGILGMIVGLGAQNLINDLVSGFFIILERSIQKGDYIRTGEAEGWVEGVGLRTTKLRSDSGEVYILKNGSITGLVNFSSEYVNAPVSMGVSAESDFDLVYKTLKEIGEKLLKEHEIIVDKLEIKGFDDIMGPEVVIATVTKVKPGTHKPASGIIQEAITRRFKEVGIEMPFEKRYKLA